MKQPRTLGSSDVFVGFLCLYLVTAGRSAPSGDAISLWEAAVNLVGRGTFAVDTPWPVNAPVGTSGHYFPVAALLAWLVHVPGALLQRALGAAAPERAPQFVVVTSQLAPLLLGALVPTLFFRLLGRLGFGPRAAALTTLLLGAATPIWVYARRPYSEILQAVCFLTFLGALLRAGDDAPARGTCLRLGLTLALLVNAKNIYLACVPGAIGHLLWRWGWRAWPATRRAPGARGLTWVTSGLAPGLLALGWYNHARWGSVLDTGYGKVTRGFWGEHPLVGLWGLFLSPGKSLFLYAPPVLLSLFGVRRLWAHRPQVAVAIALTVGPLVLIYARYLFWSGDWGWGPRYLIFALPALLIPCAELLGPAQIVAHARRPEGARAIFRAWGVWAAVLVAGAAVQAAGNAFYWDDFINISRQAQQAWLGRPDTRGDPLAPYPCFSCFEQVYPVEWLPPMQPIAGHWWLLGHKLRGDDWRVAEADAPWRRYTSLRLDIRDSYDAADIDWWPLAASSRAGGGLSVALLVCACLIAAVPVRPWIRAIRSGDRLAGPPAAAPPDAPPR